MAARGKRKLKTPRPLPANLPTGFDATPERLAKGESDVVEALREGAERMGKARRFRLSHLDRLHKSGALTWVQWQAGDHYRNAHQRSAFPLSVVASYGERVGAGDSPTVFGFGLPRQEAQARARESYRAMRSQFLPQMVGFMDRLLIHDDLPRYGGRKAMHALADIRTQLDALAHYLRLA